MAIIIIVNVVAHAPAGTIDLAQMRDTIDKKINQNDPIRNVTFNTRLALKSSKTDQPYVCCYRPTALQPMDVVSDVTYPFISVNISYSSNCDINGLIGAHQHKFYGLIPHAVQDVIKNSFFFTPIVEVISIQVMSKYYDQSTFEFRSDVEEKLNYLESQIAFIRSKL